MSTQDRALRDIVAPNLKVLFCGINPGLYSQVTGHYFARPGNRFWPTLHAAGFTDRVLLPAEERQLLTHGYGLTNLVDRATANASELVRGELVAGGARLRQTVSAYQPRFVAMLGVSAFRVAFAQPKATFGRQQESFEGAIMWVLPNPSGLNAHFQLADLARVFGELRAAVEQQ